MSNRCSAGGLRVVIPAFNAADTLEALVREVCQYVQPGQVLVVDDGSDDQTAGIARRLGTRLLRHTSNLGKGAALRDGLEATFSDSGAEACLTMDADGQHEARFIPHFLAALQTPPADVIVGARRVHPSVMPWPRVLSNCITSRLISAKVGQRIPDSQCGYRLITRRAFESIELVTTGYEFESEMLLKAGRAGLKIASIPISTIYRGEGSGIRGWRDTWRFIRTYLGSR